MSEITEIPKWNGDDNLFPAWADTYAQGKRVRPHIICQCGETTNIGNHHIHADGRVTASYLHSYPDDPERKGCGWHVYLKLKDWDGGEFKPGEDTNGNQ